MGSALTLGRTRRGIRVQGISFLPFAFQVEPVFEIPGRGMRAQDGKDVMSGFVS